MAKIFKRTVSDRLKKALIIGAAMLSLGAQEAQAGGPLKRINEALENINHFINQNILIPTDGLRHNIGRFTTNVKKIGYNTGISHGVDYALYKKVEKLIKQNGGYYQATPAEFSQAAQTTQASNSAYLNSVMSKSRKLSEEKTATSNIEGDVERVHVEKTQTRATTKSRTTTQLNPDVQKVLNILESGGR